MTAATLDRKFRAFGYFLARTPGRAGRDARWQVRSLHSLNVTWECANLPEARSLLRAVQEREARGGRRHATVYWDGDGWACADLE